MATPTLWGYDPKARYEYVPFACRNLPAEEQIVFTLRAPNLRVNEEITKHEAATAKEARKRAPGAFAVFRELAGKELKDFTPEEAEKFLKAKEEMDEAFDDFEAAASMVPLITKVLAFCVVSWKGFTDAAGVELTLPEDKREIVDMVSFSLAKELYDQCRLGGSVSAKDKTHLR